MVVDASVVVAAVVDSGPVGAWAAAMFRSRNAAPQLMPAEAANILRRSVLRQTLSADAAAVAHAELVESPISLHPYWPFADRIWALRNNLTSYDAWYVALAESLGVPLATLDGRLTRAEGPQCEFLTPRA